MCYKARVCIIRLFVLCATMGVSCVVFAQTGAKQDCLVEKCDLLSFSPDAGWHVTYGKWKDKGLVSQCERLETFTRIRYDSSRLASEKRWVTFEHAGCKMFPIASEGDTLTFACKYSSPKDTNGFPCLRVKDEKGEVFAFEPIRRTRLSQVKFVYEYEINIDNRMLWGARQPLAIATLAA